MMNGDRSKVVHKRTQGLLVVVMEEANGTDGYHVTGVQLQPR